MSRPGGILLAILCVRGKEIPVAVASQTVPKVFEPRLAGRPPIEESQRIQNRSIVRVGTPVLLDEVIVRKPTITALDQVVVVSGVARLGQILVQVNYLAQTSEKVPVLLIPYRLGGTRESLEFTIPCDGPCPLVVENKVEASKAAVPQRAPIEGVLRPPVNPVGEPLARYRIVKVLATSGSVVLPLTALLKPSIGCEFSKRRGGKPVVHSGAEHVRQEIAVSNGGVARGPCDAAMHADLGRAGVSRHQAKKDNNDYALE